MNETKRSLYSLCKDDFNVNIAAAAATCEVMESLASAPSAESEAAMTTDMTKSSRCFCVTTRAGAA